MNRWQTTRFDVDLTLPCVMGIVNVTPDSFSDGGAHATPAAALRHCEQLLRDGADMLDIGGESTRPGSPPLPLDQELARVLPVLAGAVKLGVPVSVDTYKAEVMQAALDLGADIVNDVWALRQPGAADVVARHGFDRDTVARIERLLSIAEYKRRQAPPGVKLSTRNFGRDRRYPITHGFRTA